MVSRSERQCVLVNLRLFGNDSVRCQAQNIKPPISDQAKIGGGRDCYARIEEGRVFHGIAIETMGPEFQHGLITLWRTGGG